VTIFPLRFVKIKGLRIKRNSVKIFCFTKASLFVLKIFQKIKISDKPNSSFSAKTHSTRKLIFSSNLSLKCIISTPNAFPLSLSPHYLSRPRFSIYNSKTKKLTKNYHTSTPRNELQDSYRFGCRFGYLLFCFCQEPNFLIQ